MLTPPHVIKHFYDYSIYMGYMLVSMLVQSDYIINADYNGCLSMHTLGVQTIKIAGVYYKESNCGSINLMTSKLLSHTRQLFNS